MPQPMPSMICVRPRRGAFTLAEILVVVVILGIMAAVVGVSIGSRDDLRVQATSRVLMADLLYAQSRAIVRREPHYVLIGPGGKSLRIATRQGGGWETLVHPVERTPFEMVFGADGRGGGQHVKLKTHDYAGHAVFGFDETGAPIFCDANGASRLEAVTDVTFTLSAGTYELKVIVQPITGETSIAK